MERVLPNNSQQLHAVELTALAPSHLASYGWFSFVQDFDAAAGYASDGIDVSRACLAGLIPYFEPWGSNLAFAGKV